MAKKSYGKEQKNYGGGRNRRIVDPAHAPYNFVRLPKKPLEADTMSIGEREEEMKIPQRHDRYVPGRHTGYFDVRLRTVTPLFVRGMLTTAEKAEKEGKVESRTNSQFFTVDGQKPVIPGSSLRGMLRNLTEIITYSKIHFVSDAHPMFFRAVAAEKSDPLKAPYEEIMGRYGANVRAGYLVYQNGNWFIHPARRFSQKSYYGKVKDKSQQIKDVIGLKRFDAPDYTVQYHEVCYDAEGEIITRVYTPQADEEPTATLVCTGNMAETQDGDSGKRIATPRRSYALVLRENPKAKLIPISEKSIKDYKNGLTAFQKDEPFHETNGILMRGWPVFYIEEGGEVIRFGHTPNFRVTPLQDGRAITALDRVPREMRDNSKLDFAEALFGYVAEDDAEKKLREKHKLASAYAGRISVTSAHVTEERDDYYDREFIPKILGSPKPTTFQHYLVQPQGVRTPMNHLLHYGDRTSIRGHKLYWRQRINGVSAAEEQDKSKNPERSTQHTIMKPVRTGVEFAFRVYFENLSDAELGALVWVMTLGNDPEARHQLGMAKPLGLGVVQLQSRLFLTERQKHEEELGRYQKLFNEDGSWYTAEYEITADEQVELMAIFKETIHTQLGIDFDNDERIKELKAMLKLRQPNSKLFSYMRIENDRKENEYQGRPVLPRPTEI